MAGQHIEREARFELTGMTDLQRDRTILNLYRRRWPQRDIAAALGMTPAAIKYAIDRLTGTPRRQSKKVFDDEMEVDPIPPPESWD
jgi:hypothetical protein